MKKHLLFLVVFLSNLAYAQHVPSSYYATNPSGQYGTAGTITIDGTITDWTAAKLVCQGVANDDPRIFRGSHEGPVYDLYAMYASWDANNLYLMWQYSNVTDVADPAQGYPISDNGKPYQVNIPISIALDLDPNSQTDGLIDGTTNSVWSAGTFNSYANGMDRLLMFSTKPGVGLPAMFKMNANGKFDYTAANAIPFATAGITYQYGNSFLTPTLYGINSNGGSGYVPANLANAASYINFKTAGLGHVNTQETFYEMKIPLASLGITQAYLEANGIGAMIISTFGNSAIESLPHDLITLDHATLPYTQDASTSNEKEDADNFTVPMARIGHAFVPCGITEIPTVVASPASILEGASSTLTASGCAATQTYKWDSGQTTAAITVSPTATTVYKARCVGTCEGQLSAGTTLTVTCTAPTQTPSVTPGSASTAAGVSTTLTASGCGAGQTYLWSSGQTTAAISVAPMVTASYSAKCVSATGCPGPTSNNVTITITGGSVCKTFTWDNATMYFLLLDRFNNGITANDASYGRQSDPAGGFMGGDFKGLTTKITEGYFDNLGVDALWITAPYEQMHGYVTGYGSDPAFQKHYAYHGYYPLDFTQPDAAYGTKNEFRALVDTAHKHGIRIVMDVVMNHLAYDNQGDINEYAGGFPVSDAANAGWCNWWGSSWIRKNGGYCATPGGTDDLTLPLAGLPDVKTEVTTSAASTTAGLPPLLQTKWGPSKENRLAAEVTSLDAYFTRTGKPKSPRHYITKWLTDWVKEYGIDAFRIDTYKHVGRDAWGELNDEADYALAQWKAANPTKKLDDKPFWSVGEWYGAGVGKNTETVTTGKTDALINFAFKGVAGNPTALNSTYSTYASTVNPDPTWNVLSYISSHDDNMFDRGNLINAGTSLMMAPGAVQIYYGDETARPLGTVAAGTDQPWRSFMNWGSINTGVLTHWQKLGKFRKAHPAVGGGSHAQINATPFTFSRTLNSTEICGGCDKVVVVFGASGSTTVNVSSVFANGAVLKDAYTGNTATVSAGNVVFTAGSNGVILIENPMGCLTCTPPTEIPTVAATPTTIPYGSNSTISATGCAAGQTYKWETGQTTASIIVSPTTTTASYKASCVSGAGCQGTYSAVATVTVTGVPALTVYFKRPAAWTVVPKVYGWTGASTTVTAAWPGDAMTVHCGTWYKYTFPAGTTSANVVFNNGTGTVAGVDKTADILGITVDGRYDGTVSMTATTTVAGAPTDCPCTPPTEIPTITPSAVSIASGASTTLTASGCGAGQTYKWSSLQTTAAITVAPTATTTYTAKCVTAAACEGTASAIATVTVAGTGVTVYFKRPAAWTVVPNAYAWTGASTAINGAWPGGAMTLHCGTWYKYTFPAGTTTANVIFNNGSGGGANQTPDLLNISATSRYDGTVSMTATTLVAGEPTDCPCTPPAAPSVTASPASIATGATSSLTAAGCAGTVNWFAAATGGTAIGTGATFTTPALTTTTMYYAECQASVGCVSATRGSVTVTVTCVVPTQVPTITPTSISIASGVSTVLTASGCSGAGQTYLWSSAQTTAAITVAPTATTTYTAKCVSSTGCQGTASSVATITVTGGVACDKFTWDNATTYFLLLDRFNNGISGNDGSYGRVSDPAGGFMGGDFKGVTNKISEGYFDNLGVNSIWITAPYEQMHGFVPGYGTDPAFQKHYAYHGYYPLDFTQPDAAYGTKNEFQAMVDSAHKHGIRIVMDIVMNHLAYDNQGDVNEYLGGFAVGDAANAGWCNWWGNSWIRKTGGYCATTPGGDDLTMSLAGLPDIKTEITTSAASTTAGLPPLLQTKWGPSKENRLAAEVASLDAYFTRTGKPKSPRHYLIKWLTDWVKTYGIDAFRIDTYKHVGRDAWGELNDEADYALAQWKAANPTKKLDDKPFWTVGEWWGHGIGKNTEAVTTGKTDALINFNFKGVAGSPTTLNTTYSSYASTLNTDPTWNAMSYVSSHDDGMFDRGNLINAGTSLLLAPGAVQIYYGDETARPLGTVAANTDQPTRSFMNWGSINTAVQSHWQKIGKFRKNHPAIGAGSHAQITASPYTFSRQISSADACIGCDKIIVVVGASGSTTVNVSSLFANGTLLKDAYTGATATVSGGNAVFTAGTNGVILIENPAGCAVCTPPTEIPTVVASPSTITSGASSTITASGCAAGQTYKWETGQTTASITVSPTAATTTYKAKCVAANGCEGTLSAGTVLTVTGGSTGITVYFKRPASWTAVPKIYGWTGATTLVTALTAAWPGDNMTLHCGSWYKYIYPAGVTPVNAVFNNGTGTAAGIDQSPDILNITADGRYDGTTSPMTATSLTAGAPIDCPCTPPAAPTATATPASIASGATSSLTATGCTGTVNWFAAASGGTAIGTGTFTTPALTATTMYYAECQASVGCVSATRGSVTVTVTAGCGSTDISVTTNIASGTVKHETNGKITATNKVIGTSNTTYDSQKSVTLLPGFEAKATGGTVFKAIIEGCGGTN